MSSEPCLPANSASESSLGGPNTYDETPKVVTIPAEDTEAFLAFMNAPPCRRPEAWKRAMSAALPIIDS